MLVLTVQCMILKVRGTSFLKISMPIVLESLVRKSSKLNVGRIKMPKSRANNRAKVFVKANGETSFPLVPAWQIRVES